MVMFPFFNTAFLREHNLSTLVRLSALSGLLEMLDLYVSGKRNGEYRIDAPDVAASADV